MTWVKLDDQFFRNPKALAAGKDGRALYLAGVCFCAAQLTDGWLATEALPGVAADAGVKVSVARLLERVGLWEQGVGGFWIHDYLKYNPPAERVRDLRAKKAAAGAKGGKAAADARADAVASAVPSALPGGSGSGVPPFPVPSPPPDEGQNLLVEGEVKMPDLRLERGLG